MKVKLLNSVISAVIAYWLILSTFFLIAFVNPRVYFLVVLHGTPAPFILGITAAVLTQRWLPEYNDSGNKWIAVAGVLGGLISAVVLAGLISSVLPSETLLYSLLDSYILRILFFIILQSVCGTVVQALIVLLLRLWANRPA